MKKIALFEPNLSSLEKKLALESITNNQISTYGSYVNLLEKEIKEITLSKYNLATNSGSSALFLALKSVGVKNDEIVITQSYTFAATTNAILLNNSIPLLLDISRETLNIDFDQLEKFLKYKTFHNRGSTFHKISKKKISCLCLVFTLGIIPDLKKLNHYKKKYNLKIVFDAACALGHKFNNEKLTKYCDVVIYSLNGNKNFTSGAGGIFSSDHYKYYDFARKFSNNGKIFNAYDYKMIGFNFKMNSLNAAVGLAQIKRFNNIITQKIKIYNYYKKKLLPINLFNFKFPWGIFYPWMNFFLVRNKKLKMKIIQKLKKNNFMVNNFWLPMHKQSIKNYFLHTAYKNTNYIYNRILVLPSSTFLSYRTINKICKIIKEIV